MIPRIAFLALLSTSLSVIAADWPQWRGQNRDDKSTETGLLQSWPADGPKLDWIFKDAGIGYSGYSIVGDTLYTMGARDAVEYVIAVDAKTGKEKWSTSVGALLTNDWGDGPRGTPSVSGDKVYALGGKGDLVCLAASDGKQLWTASLVENGGKVPGWGYTESVLVDGDLVIATPGGAQGTTIAFDKNTGAKKWQSADWTDPAHYSSPIAVDLNGKRQIIQLTMQSVGGVDAKDGKLLWKVPFPGKVAVIPTPIYSDGHVFVCAGYNVGGKLVKILPENVTEDLTPDMNQNMINHHGGVILHEGHLFGYSEKGGWTCMEFKTGAVKWQDRSFGKGAIHYADGKFILLEEKTGNVALINASVDGWREISRFTLTPQTTLRKPKGMIWTHPVVANGKLYLRDQELVFCFSVKE